MNKHRSRNTFSEVALHKTEKQLQEERKTLKETEENLRQEKSFVFDLIHELKKINQRIDVNVEQANNALSTIIDSDNNSSEYVESAYTLLENTCKSIESLSSLSNLRMELYEYLTSPDVFLCMEPRRIHIYKKFEKIYKSINGGNDNSVKSFKLGGNSFGRFSSPQILQIAIFIILENAWKYSPSSKDIIINFSESNSTLTVDIINWGPVVQPSEINALTQRGYRGIAAQKETNIEGKGLGLSIAEDIFKNCNVEMIINTEDGVPEWCGGRLCAPFHVKLIFDPILN